MSKKELKKEKELRISSIPAEETISDNAEDLTEYSPISFSEETGDPNDVIDIDTKPEHINTLEDDFKVKNLLKKI